MGRRLSILWALALALGFTSPALAQSRFALSIGSNLGLGGDSALRFAEEDARRFDQLLGEIGDVPAGHRTLLLRPRAEQVSAAFERTRSQVEEAARRGESTLLFVYYSGHGDTQALRIAGSPLPLVHLRSLVESIPARTSLVIVDACHSGALVRGKGLKLGAGFDVSMRREVGPEGRVYIASASAEEVAQESDAFSGSAFTHHLLSGLRGAADSNGSGSVTLEEAYRYVYNRTLASSHAGTSAVQHPSFRSTLAGEGELVLVTPSRARARLVLAAAVRGSVLVVNDRDGSVVAEVHKAEGAPIELGLAPGRYRVQVRDADQIFLGEFSLPWGGRQELDVEQLAPQRLLASLDKGPSLELSRWQLEAGLGAASTMARSVEGGILAQIAATYTLTRPLIARASFEATQGNGQNERWSFRAREVGLWLGLGLGSSEAFWAAHAAIQAGGAFIQERATREDAARIAELTSAQVADSTWALGAGVGLEAAARLALFSDWSLGIGGSGRVVVTREDEAQVLRLCWTGVVSVANEF